MTTAIAEEKHAPALVPEKRVHLGYLDGIRGLAALYVAINHVFWGINLREGSPLFSRLGVWTALLGFGPLSVVVFIVLSGYCLTIPVARSSSHSLRGGAMDYIKRRARRILPPYYAALMLSLLLTALLPSLRHLGADQEWNLALPIGKGSLISHLLLMHNFNKDWIFKINAPLWSVATEWQIYFLLPLVLLPVWKRFGLTIAVLIGVALGTAPCLLARTFDIWACPWFVGLFAFGMAAAAIGFSADPKYAALRGRIPWMAISGILAVPFFVFLMLNWKNHPARYWYQLDTSMGIITALFLIGCTRSLEAQPNGFVRFFQWRGFEKLGAFSYSVYLIHQPILSLIGLILRHFHVGPTTEFIVSILFGMPVCLALSYGFHLAFEKPFMTVPRKSAVV